MPPRRRAPDALPCAAAVARARARLPGLTARARAVPAALGAQPQPGFAVRCIGDAAVVRVVVRPNLADPTRQVRACVPVNAQPTAVPLN